MQWGWWALQQNPCALQWFLSWFTSCVSRTRWAALTQSFLWHRWLTSRLLWSSQAHLCHKNKPMHSFNLWSLLWPSHFHNTNPLDSGGAFSHKTPPGPLWISLFSKIFNLNCSKKIFNVTISIILDFLWNFISLKVRKGQMGSL